jgi:SAM-dependent methyltransferase
MAKQPKNDLDLSKEGWKQPAQADLRTSSLWLFPEGRDQSGLHHSAFHGAFIPQLVNQYLRRFTQAGDWVLDPLCGSGTALIEGVKLGRNMVGVDLSPACVEQSYLAGLATRSLEASVATVQVACGDASDPELGPKLRAAIPELPEAGLQGLIYHPPYHSIVAFNPGNPACLSQCATLAEFLERWRAVVQATLPLLAPDRHGLLVIGDIWLQGQWVTLGADCWRVLQSEGARLVGKCVKDFGETEGKKGQRGLQRYRALRDGTFSFDCEELYFFSRQT